jgi:hypothetical protein
LIFADNMATRSGANGAIDALRPDEGIGYAEPARRPRESVGEFHPALRHSGVNVQVKKK